MKTTKKAKKIGRGFLSCFFFYYLNFEILFIDLFHNLGFLIHYFLCKQFIIKERKRDETHNGEDNLCQKISSNLFALKRSINAVILGE